MPKSLALFLSAGALALGIAACGGSSSHSSTAAASAPTPTSTGAAATTGAGATSTGAAPASGGSSSSGASTKLTIAAAKSGMLMFTKSTLTAKAGTVQISFTNDSSLGHNLSVQKGTSGAVVGSTPTFTGGTKLLTLHLTAGKYTFFCSVPGHRQGGMQGTLTVS